MKTIYKKLANARQAIKQTKIKKAGFNDYSKYEYFTPEQIDLLTFEVCQANGLLNKYDLKRTNLGLVATMQVIEIETGESEVFELAMEIPDIKATNISQQLGGAMTYSKRYLLMNIYDISDNTLDFDTPNKIWLTDEQFNKAMASDIKGIQAVLTTFSGNGKDMKKEYRAMLLDKLNILKNG